MALKAAQKSLTYVSDMLEPWVAERDMTDQFRQVAIVTGGNSGIGLEIVRQLSRNQAHVIMASRNQQKAERAIKEIKVDIPWANVEYMHVDLSSFRSVAQFANEFRARNLPLHMLFNNAGGFFPPPQLTEDGFDVTLQVDYFGHFLLTMLLLNVLRASAPSRIINEVSQAHMYGWIDWNDLRGRYFENNNLGRGLRAYGTSKLMMLMWSLELHKRLRGNGIDVFAVHPGVCSSPLAKKVDLVTYFPLSNYFSALISAYGQRPRYGACSALYAATEPRLQGHGGCYIGPEPLFGRSFNTSNRWPLHPQEWNAANQEELYDESIKILQEATATLPGMKGGPGMKGEEGVKEEGGKKGEVGKSACPRHIPVHAKEP